MTRSTGKTNISPSAPEVERRRAKRIPILASFSLSVVVPRKGMHKLAIYDVSETGIGFILNIEEEFSTQFPSTVHDSLDIHFYLNNSLFLPLSVRTVRIEDAQTGERRIGAEFEKCKTESFQAFLAFLSFLDKLQPSAVLTSQNNRE